MAYDWTHGSLFQNRYVMYKEAEGQTWHQCCQLGNPDILKEKAVSKKQQKFMGMVRAAQKGEGASSPEVAKVASSMKKGDVKDFASTKHKGLPEKKVKKESFESGVQKARRDYRSGTLLTFKQFMSKLTDILDEWEK